MEIYQMYFDAGRAGKPYETEEEAREEAFSMVDAFLFAAYQARELWKEPLDMRGVVITPQEFRDALQLRTAEQKKICGENRQEARKALKPVKEHVDSRKNASEKRFRIWEAAGVCELTELEEFCYLLAAAVEWDRKYERIYGYLQDNVGAKMPTKGLGISLWALSENPAGKASALKEDGPLWEFLLQRESRKEYPPEESSLSKAMVLKGEVISYLYEGDALPGSWKKIICKKTGKEGKRLEVSLPRLLEYGQESGRGLAELLGSAAWIGKLWGISACAVTGGAGAGAREWKTSEERLADWGFSCPKGEGTDAWVNPWTVRVTPVYTWDDLIVEESQQQFMRQICSQVRYRETVSGEWGFGKKSPYGNGISAVFYGPPGTGKTMAAQVIARELGLELYKVDLSQLVSKYIGETEKNLRRLFDEAKEDNAVLLFDEADGLFARRSQVDSSNDRYANMETGYLLQKFEEYDGITILATNYVKNMDDAFKRRIRFMVRFVFPSEETRLKLWKSMIPEEARVDEELDYGWYAKKFELAGSGIKEIVTNAAYLAAAAGRGITNGDLRRAVRTHYLKFGKSLTKKELGEESDSPDI